MKVLTLKQVLANKLSRLPNPPKYLYHSGVDPNTLVHAPLIAVVGTRKPTDYGKNATWRLVSELVSKGVIVVSGLAFGIDTIAHRAALAAGGETIAVLPSDVTAIYPSTHKAVAQQIIKTGSLLSEFIDNPHPRREHFLQRNRIIAGLCDAVLIPEAAQRSGSLNTAMHAEQMDIPVFALPGRSIDPMSAGTNHLIAHGKAQLAVNCTEILKTVGHKSVDNNIKRRPQDSHEAAVLVAIETGIQDTTLLQREVAMSTAKLQVTLTTLEINGYIAQNQTGQWHTV